MCGVVDVADVVVGVGGEGFDVEFAGGGEDAGCYLASVWVGEGIPISVSVAMCRFPFQSTMDVKTYLLATSRRFIGLGPSEDMMKRDQIDESFLGFNRSDKNILYIV